MDLGNGHKKARKMAEKGLESGNLGNRAEKSAEILGTDLGEILGNWETGKVKLGKDLGNWKRAEKLGKKCCDFLISSQFIPN